MAFNKPVILRTLVDGKNIFHEIEFSLDATTDFQEVATKDTDGKEVTPDTQSWSASASAVGSADVLADRQTELTMAQLWKAKTLVPFAVTDAVTGNVKYSGEAYVENFSVKAGVEGTVDISWSFKGNGELTIAEVA